MTSPDPKLDSGQSSTVSLWKRIAKQFVQERVIEKCKDLRIQERLLYLSKVTVFDNPTENYIFKGSRKGYKDLPKYKSLFFTPRQKGLPIGNLTSQFFANVYMNPLDQFIKRVLKCDYLRYVDDFILFGESREELFNKKERIEEFIANNLQLEIKKNFKLKRVEHGIYFLGYIIRPTYILVRKRVVNNFKYKLAQFIDGEQTQKDIEEFKKFRASYYGHFKHANSYRLINKYHM